MNKQSYLFVLLFISLLCCKAIQDQRSWIEINYGALYCTSGLYSGVCVRLNEDHTFELIAYSDQGEKHGYGHYQIEGDSLRMTYQDTLNFLPSTCVTFKPLSVDSIFINIKHSGTPYIGRFSIKKDYLNLDLYDHVYYEPPHTLIDSYQIAIPYSNNLYFVVEPIEEMAPQVVPVFARGVYNIECDRIRGPKRYYNSKNKRSVWKIIKLSKEQYQFANTILYPRDK